MMKKLSLTGLSWAIVWLLSAQSDLLLQMGFLLDGQFRELNSKDLYYFSEFDVYSRSPFDGIELEPGMSGNLLVKRDTSDRIEIYNLVGRFQPMAEEEIRLTSYASNSTLALEWILKKLSRDTIKFYNYLEQTEITLIKDHKNLRHETCFFDGSYWKLVPAEKKKGNGSRLSDTLVFSFTKYQNNGRYWGFGNYFYAKISDLFEVESIQIATHSGFSYDVIHFAGSDYLLMCWDDCILYKILKVEEDKITLSSPKYGIEIFYKTKDW